MKATQPDNKGHFGKYGGMYVPETLMEPLNELTRVFKQAKKDGATAFFGGVCGAADPALFGRADDRRARDRSNLSQARGSLPYWSAQD
jgi:hypothetical protein